MSCECKETEHKRNYYRYYDTPDGCDVFKKILVTSRYGAMIGLYFSTYDVLMYSHAIGFGPIMRRYAYHTIPLTLMGATFAAVSNSVLQARQKDDVLNYFIGKCTTNRLSVQPFEILAGANRHTVGGAACGPLLMYYLGTYHALFLGSIALGVIGMIKKDTVTNGVSIFPEVQSHMKSVGKWRGDYTLVADPKDSIQHTCVGKK